MSEQYSQLLRLFRVAPCVAEGCETGRHTVRAGAGAAVGVVTELMNVEASLGVGVMASQVPADGGGGVLIGLLEGDLARDLGVSSEDGN